MKLEVGMKMPNYTFNTHVKENQTVSEVVKKADKTVFWVLRYIGCTVCRYDVHLICQNYQKFVDEGAQVYVVMQSKPEIVNNDLKDSPIPFEIICDVDMSIYQDLAIGSFDTMAPEAMEKLKIKGGNARALGFSHGEYEGNEKQLPAMFITDKESTVLYAHYAENIVDMPTVDECLDLLKTL